MTHYSKDHEADFIGCLHDAGEAVQNEPNWIPYWTVEACLNCFMSPILSELPVAKRHQSGLHDLLGFEELTGIRNASFPGVHETLR